MVSFGIWRGFCVVVQAVTGAVAVAVVQTRNNQKETSMRMFRNLMLLSVCLLGGRALAGEGLMIEDPWVREPPPMASALGGFMTIHNPSGTERVLVGASSPAFGSVMLHRTVAQDGMMRMLHQHAITIPAHGMLAFEPGGYHIMLMQPKQPLKAGDKVEVTLQFQDGASETVTYEVRADAGMHHGGHMMQH